MRICLKCAARLIESGWGCPVCGWYPMIKNGLPILSPDLTSGFPDYPVEAHDRRVHLEENNFWFICRNHIIINCLGIFFPNAKNLMEIGCGTGFVLSGISKAFPEIELFGADAYPSALKYAGERVQKAEFAQMDAYRLPFIEEFNVIGAFDVLEHMSDDLLALKGIYKATQQGGGIILSVPQHPWLWSVLDEKACHKRRYTRKELKNKVQAAGFDVLYMTSFIMLLLPLMLLSRWRKVRQYENKAHNIKCELDLSKPLNALFKFICLREAYLIRKGFSLPSGGSLLCVARKRVL